MPRQKKDENQEKSQRRARGEGTVVQRADGRYVARVPLGGGKRKEEYYDTKQEAERAKRRMLNERDKGTLALERDQTFEAYLLYWLDAHRVTVRETTHSMYDMYMKGRVIPVLGHVKLRKLKMEMFQSLYQKWEGELSSNTIRLIHGIVNTALKDAVKWRKIVYNPVQDVKLPKASKPKNVYVLNNEEVKRLLGYAQQVKLYPLFCMALLLGMRIGELSGLKWSDIDFEKRTLLIQRTLYYLRDPSTGIYKFHLGDTKTDAGQRLIQLPSDVVVILLAHFQQQAQLRAVSPNWGHPEFVFCNRSGGFLNPNWVRSSFDRLLKRANLKHMKFHALRHNASLILRSLGIDSVVRKEMLGHSSLIMTDDVYGHSTPEMHRKAANEIEHFFGEKES